MSLTMATATAQISETATEAVRNMGLGWNLGNTLDANSQKITDVSTDGYWGQQGLESETCWGQPYTHSELFAMLKNGGFGAIRIPVTWYNHMDKDGNIDADWMARVHEVVDYVIDEGLYCIINSHHDTGADSDTFTSWLKADETIFSNNKQRYEDMWKQIAEEFRDYDEHLLFEAYNEMLDVKSSWCYASFNTKNNYDATISASAYNAINSYAQSFVETVRATGGNNATRNIIVNTYAASNGYGSWSTHLTDPLTKMALPNDSIAGHLIFEVHTYPSIATTNSQGTTVDRSISAIRSEVDGIIKVAKQHLVSKGAPVIFGEWGTSNVDSGTGKTDYDVRRNLMLQFVEYFVKQAKANDMAVFYWMGISDGLYRNMPAFSQPDLAKTMAKAYHGDDFEGDYPDGSQIESYTCFEGDKLLEWGNGINIAGSLFEMIGSTAQLELTYQRTGASDDIQLYYGDWSSKPSFFVEGNTFNGDFSPSNYYHTATGTEHTTVFTFSNGVMSNIYQKGLIIHGNKIRVSKAVVTTPEASGIGVILANKDENAIYDLQGRRLHAATLTPGIYVQGSGRKFVVK